MTSVLRRRVASAAFALAISSLARAADACAVCGCGDPTLTVMGAERPFANRIRIGGELRLGSVRVGTPGKDEISIHEQRLDFTVAWAPNATLFLSASIPVQRREATFDRGGESKAWSLGDAEIRVKAFISRAWRGPFHHQAAIQGGIKLPTAPVQEDARGTPLPVALQPGTGAISPFAGFFYGFSQGMWSFYASATVYLPFAVRPGPHASDSIRTSASAQVQPARAFAARLGVDTRLDSTSEMNDVVDPNSGGFVGYVSPEILLSPADDLLLLVGAHFPALQALHGQHREGAMLAVGLNYDF